MKHCIKYGVPKLECPRSFIFDVYSLFNPFCGKFYAHVKYPKEQNFIKILLCNIIFMLLNEIIKLPSLDQTYYNIA